MLKLIALICAVVAALVPVKQEQKQEVPEYKAPEWEYVAWADVPAGEDGGDIYLG